MICFFRNRGDRAVSLVSVFVKSIVNVVGDYTLGVTVLKQNVFEDHLEQISARKQRSKLGSNDK